MNLRLLREPSGLRHTHGALFIDGHWFCWTVEDVVREVAGQPVSTWKVPGETAIPYGRYRVVVTRSKRFGVDLPEVLDVPGFTGIRIHAGNGFQDTDGCVLPGLRRSASGVLDSRMAMSGLMSFLEMAKDAKDHVWLSVEAA